MFVSLSVLKNGRPLVWLLFWALVLLPIPASSNDGILSWADRMLSERSHDFGQPPLGTSARHTITISNIYKEPITISEVASSASEIKAEFGKLVLQSKETTQLTLTLYQPASNNTVRGDVTFKMTFDGVNYKTVTVPVSAFTSQAAATPTRVARPGGNWAEQMCSEIRHDFGPVARGAVAQHDIEITNLYKEDITLTSPVSSCGCISPQLDKLVLKSKESAHLVLTLDTVRFSKKRDVTVSLSATFDRLNYKEVRIPVSAYIRSDVVFDPGSVQLGVVSFGEAADRRVRVTYAGRDSWTVRSVRKNNPHLESELREVSRGGGRVEYELLVRLVATAPKGVIRDQLVLETDDTLNPTIPLLVEGTVEADLQVTPEVAQFGQLKAGVPKIVNVVVKGKQPFRIEKVECDSTRECFAVSLPQTEKTVQIVALTITPPPEAGEFKETFTVTIAGRKQTLSFRAVGSISVAEAPAREELQAPPESTETTPPVEKTTVPSGEAVPSEGVNPAEPPPAGSADTTEPADSLEGGNPSVEVPELKTP